ncbi:MAG TPA: hypothetical protein VFX43_15055 [Chitinophagaceae bacterium]|nr:hypothetical protein [Chitinophagaceae bacterium]
MNIPSYIQRGLLAAGLIFPISSLHAQQVKLGTPDYVKHKMPTTDIRSSPGVLGDHYYVIYRDFGAAFDVKKDVETYIKDYSIKRGHLTKSIYLNPVVDPEAKRLLINQVYLWKGRFLALFTEKNATGREFSINARLVDLNGKALGSSELLGFYPQVARPGGLSGVIFPKGRSTLAPTPTFGLLSAFSSDSSSLAILAVAKGEKTQASLLIVDPELHVVDKLACNFAIDENEFQMLQFRRYRSGPMYVLIREGKTLNRKHAIYDLFRIDTRTHRTSRIPIKVPEEIILDARFCFDAQGNVMVTGCYTHKHGHGKLTATHGVFAVRVSGSNGLVMGTEASPFPADLVRSLRSRSAAAKGKGLDEIIEMRKALPVPGGGIVAMGQVHYNSMSAQGRTGALNQYAEEFGDVIYYGISPEGKILWSGGVERTERNPIMMTATGPIYLGSAPGRALVLYDAEKKENHSRPAVYQELYEEGRTGKTGSALIPWPRHNKSRIIWSTAVPLDEHHVVAAYYSLSDKAMGMVTITVAE